MDRIVFYLNGDRGILALKAIQNAGHNVETVVFPASSKRGEELASLVTKLGCKPAATTDVNSPEFIEFIKKMQPNLGIVGGYSTIFKNALINLPEFGTINLHGGRVPQYRGGSPLNWQIINGEREIGISVLRMDERVDAGSVVAESTIQLSLEDDIASIHKKANDLFPKLLVEALSVIDSNSTDIRVQDEKHAKYWHQRNEADGMINWHHMTASKVINTVRAITRPYPGAFTFLNNEKIRIFKAREQAEQICGVPGRIFYLLGEGPLVICADRAVVLEEYARDDGDRIRLSTGMHFD